MGYGGLVSEELRECTEYKPHPAQRVFHADRFKVKYRAIFAGTGSGKTIAGLAECLKWCQKQPGIVGYVYEPTYPMVRRILIPTLEDEMLLGRPLELNPVVQEYIKSDGKITFKNGSTIWFSSLDEPERAEGVNVDFLHVDEARLVRDFETAWITLRRRLRGSQRGKYPIGAWVTTTPDRSHSPLYNFFEGVTTRNEESKVYRWTTFDNPFLKEDFKRDMQLAHTGGLAERFLYGRFADVDAGSFAFEYQKHVIQNVEKANLRRVFYGVDWGWTNPSAVVALGFDGDGRLYVLDEFYKAQAQKEEILGAIKEMQAAWGAGIVHCDSNEPASIDFMKRNGINAHPNTSKREEGIREIGGRLNVAGDGRQRLYILSRCVNTIDEMQTYDEKVKEHDHLVDAIRYGLMGVQGGMVRTQPIYIIAKRYG